MIRIQRSNRKPEQYAGGFPVVSLVIEEDDREGYAELWRVDVDDARVTSDEKRGPLHGFNLEVTLWPKGDAPQETSTAYGLWWLVDYEVVDWFINLAMSVSQEDDPLALPNGQWPEDQWPCPWCGESPVRFVSAEHLEGDDNLEWCPECGFHTYKEA